MFTRCSMSASNHICHVRSFRICHQRHNSWASSLSPLRWLMITLWLAATCSRRRPTSSCFWGWRSRCRRAKAALSRGGSGRAGSSRFAFQVRIRRDCCTPVVKAQSVGWSRSVRSHSECVVWSTQTSLLTSEPQWTHSGCGKSGRPDILSHIPRIPLGIAGVPGEVCSVFILPSVALNPTAVYQEGREKENV